MALDRVVRRLPDSKAAAVNVSRSASEHLLSPPSISASPQNQLISDLQLTPQETATEGSPAAGHTESGLSITQIVSIPDPFVGFVGHSFLHFCQAVDVVTRLMKPRYSSAELAAQSLLSSPRSPWKHWGACSVGTICCTVVAALLIPLFDASSLKAFLPIPFLLIIVLVALGFGRAAGVLGTLTAAFLFAWFLYEPAGLAVSDPVAKSHLIWMMIIGVLLSDLLARLRLRTTAVFSAYKNRTHT